MRPLLIETIRLTGKADYMCHGTLHHLALYACQCILIVRLISTHPQPRYTVFGIDLITFHNSPRHHDNIKILRPFITNCLTHNSLLARLDFIRLERELHTFKPTLSKPPKYITARYKVKTGQICDSIYNCVVYAYMPIYMYMHRHMYLCVRMYCTTECASQHDYYYSGGE
jgi:hypothetical protein